MPVWNATYQVRDFVQYVTGFQVRDAGGAALAPRKVNPSLWRLPAHGTGRVEVEYRVRADRPGPFGAVADAQHVCLNLAQVLLYPVAARNSAFTLRFVNVPKEWKTAIELTKRDDGYRAGSYDELIDTPVHLSDFEDIEFEYAGRRIRLAIHGPAGTHNTGLLRETAEAVVAAASEVMDDVPFPSYTFVYHFLGNGGGGMEYRNGTSIYAPSQCRRCDLSELTAHEFFHLWNVKRIRPRSLYPIDFTAPNLTPSLWFSEGVTSSYAWFLGLRSGLTTPEKFLEHFASLIYDYESRPASRTQSAEEASLEAWLEGYPAYGRPDRSVSYYVRGEIIGYLLDLAIRHQTANRRSLDDVLRLLNREYAMQGRFFEDTAAIEQAASKVAGTDLSPVIEKLVRSAAPIAWDEYLGFAGLQLLPNQRDRMDAGVSFTRLLDGGVVVSGVESGGAGEQAGFRPGDEILRIGNEQPQGLREISSFLMQAAGSSVRIEVSRDGARLTMTLHPRTTQDVFYRMIEVADASPAQRRVRQGWLRRETEPAAPANAAGL
jgi:predicted metalloprotease with PDZ domain